MRKLFPFAIIIIAIGLTFMLTACEKEGPAEKAGKKVDSLIEKTKENVSSAAEEAKEAAEKAKKKAEDEVNY
jgi:F0F1-type ATP synthase membrane subunit b/b'